MDKKIIDAFIYLASAARLAPHEQEQLLDMICNHEETEKYNDGSGNDWDRCVNCGKLKIK